METTQSGIIERIRYLMMQNRLTQAQLAQRIGLDPSNVSKYLSGKLVITDSLLNRIIVNLGVSKAWLKEGVGLPYDKPLHAAELTCDSALQLAPGGRGIPVFDIDVTAGAAELSRMFTADRVIGVVNLPGFECADDCCIVPVAGDSMEPVIHNGGYLLIKRTPCTPHNIFWGQIYVVILDEYRMVKFVRRHADSDKVILRSANRAYDDMDIERDDIKALYLVEKILNIDIRC